MIVSKYQSVYEIFINQALITFTAITSGVWGRVYKN